MDLKRLGTRGLRHYGNSVLHPHRVTGVLGRGRLQPCAQVKHMHKRCQQIRTAIASISVMYEQHHAICKIKSERSDSVLCRHTDVFAFNRCQNPSAMFEHSNITWKNKNSSHGNSIKTVSNNGNSFYHPFHRKNK